LGCAAADLPRARWLENGLIDAGGSHEPLTFMLRVGGESREARQALDARADASGIHFRMPEIATYSVVVVDWR
jgi:hypothetical protein